MSMQPIHSQIDINIEQIELDWVSNEYSSNNSNRNRLPKDETLNCLLDSVRWKDRENLKYIEMYSRNEALAKYFFIGYKRSAYKLSKWKNEYL